MQIKVVSLILEKKKRSLKKSGKECLEIFDNLFNRISIVHVQKHLSDYRSLISINKAKFPLRARSQLKNVVKLSQKAKKKKSFSKVISF